MSRQNNQNKASSPSKSAAQIIFEGKDFIISRPPDMEFKEYKILQRIQNEVMKRLFRKGHSPSRRVARLLPPSAGRRFYFQPPCSSVLEYLKTVSPSPLKPDDSEQS